MPVNGWTYLMMGHTKQSVDHYIYPQFPAQALSIGRPGGQILPSFWPMSSFSPKTQCDKLHQGHDWTTTGEVSMLLYEYRVREPQPNHKGRYEP